MNLLVVVDGSQHSDSALEIAVAFAQRDGVAITVACLVKDPWMAYSGVLALEEDPEALVEVERRTMEEHALHRFPTGVSVRCVSRRGRFRTAVRGLARERPYDLMVVGTRRRPRRSTLHGVPMMAAT